METVEQLVYLKSRQEPLTPEDHRPSYDRLCRKIMLAPGARKFADRLWLIRYRKDVAFGSVLFGILVPTSAIGFKFAAVGSGSAHLFPDGFRAMASGQVAGFYWIMALLVALVSSRNIFQLYYESHKTRGNFFWALVVVLIVELTWLSVPFAPAPWAADNVGLAVGCDIAVLIAYLAGFVFNTLVYGSRFVEDQIADDLRSDASLHEEQRAARLAAAKAAEVYLAKIREALVANRDTDGKLARYAELEGQCARLDEQISGLISRESAAVEEAKAASAALVELETKHSALRAAYFAVGRFLFKNRSMRGRVHLTLTGNWPSVDSFDSASDSVGAAPAAGASDGLALGLFDKPDDGKPAETVTMPVSPA